MYSDAKGWLFMNAVNTKKNSVFSIANMAKIGILSAIAVLLMLLEFPLWFAPSFYEIDFSEMVVAIGGFAMGPVAGVVIELIKVLLNLLINGTDTGGVGELANFLIGCSFVVPAALLYQYKKTLKTAIIGLGLGTLCMTVVGCAMNYFVLLPVYATVFGMPLDKIVEMGTLVNGGIRNLFTFVVLAVAPFNLFKGILSSILTVLLYKRVSGVLHKY